MESSGLAVAAPPASLPTGITIKDTSNHMAVQQMSFHDATALFATPPQNTADNSKDHSATESAEQSVIENKDMVDSNPMPASKDLRPSKPEFGRLEEAVSEIVANRVPDGEIDLNGLDTPVRPTHDHGIESNMRDTLDTDLTDNALFKVESLPQHQAPDLSLFESFSGPDTIPVRKGFSSEHALNAEPITPMHVQGTYTRSPPVAEEEPSVHQAYAMLKFPDSYYYVKSVNLVITRDEQFYKLWREEKKANRRKYKAQRRAQETLDNYAREPSHHSQYGGDDVDEELVGRPVHGLLSTYSDVGGAVSYADPESAFESAKALIQRSRRSKNNSSSNHSIAPRSLHEFEFGDELQDDVVNDSEGKALDRQEWAQVAIHPQHIPDIEKISREHLIIRYDGVKRSWVMDVIGNRVLHNGELRSRGESDIDLSHDDEIIIISVSFRFMLPIDQELDVLDSVENDDYDDEDDDELETSPAARKMADTVNLESDEQGESSEEDVPLALQHKPSKGKGKKPKGKEPKPKLVKLKLTNKNASKKAEAAPDAGKQDEKKERPKGKAPAKTGGKLPAKATKTAPKAEEAEEEPFTKEEVDASKASGEEEVIPSTEVHPPDATQALQPLQATQASPRAPINLDANSAFAGADPSQLPQKRKGPGRPPKNGLISKRDDAGVKRKVKEYERQGLALPPMNELLELVRAEQRQKDAAAKAASRGEAAPDMGMQNVDPRMQSYNMAYLSTTPSQPQQAAPAGSGTPQDLPTTRSTSPRPRRPAKSPSPMPAQESFSEEQLKKPTITYVFIIDEILQDPALDGQADLQTIYDKIQKRWPYFKYGTTTNGWQSSVRHNLLQCARFVESGKSGKGKYWKINFEHELDPKKRKQVTPPPNTMPRNGSNAPPYQQTYNASYPQGLSGSGNTPAMGQPPNGQYTQPAYGQSNGNRPPSQQPAPPPQQTPQHFATIVQAIISYRVQFLGPHKDKPTHGPAEQQFDQALNHYSELHAGRTPLTEGNVDESQDPYKTLKEIFILYGQGDTRGSQNEPSQSVAPSTTAPPVPPHTPASTTNAAPSTNASGAVILTPATALPSTHVAQSGSGIESAVGPSSTTNELLLTAQSPLRQAGPPATISQALQQSQAPQSQGLEAVRPSQQNRPPTETTIAFQSPRHAQAQATPTPPQQSRPSAPMPQGLPRSVQVVSQGAAAQPSAVGRSPPVSGVVIARPSQAALSALPTPKPGLQQQPSRPAPAISANATMTSVVHGSQRQDPATQTTPTVVLPPSQLLRPPVSVKSGITTPQVQQVTGPEQRPPVAGMVPNNRPTPAQQPPPPPKSVSAGSMQLSTTATVLQCSPPPSAAIVSGSRPGVVSPLPPAGDLKRPAEVSTEDQDAKRLKTQSVAPSLPPKLVTTETSPGTRPEPAGVKRSTEENSDDHESKRLKTAQEAESRVATPSVTA